MDLKVAKILKIKIKMNVISPFDDKNNTFKVGTHDLLTRNIKNS